jgi:CheY-like chemotaxis protein
LLRQKPVSRGLPHLRPESPAIRLLIVDDKEDNRSLLRQVLAPTGFELREAVNGVDGLSQFEAWSPHLILMDLIMPTMDGYEAIRRIRATEDSGRKVKSIALTASAFEENRKEAISAGADEFMSKPFRETELFELIGLLLGVEYDYENQEPYPLAAEGKLAAESQTALPDGLLTQIGEAVLIGDYEGVTELIAQVARRNTKLAQALSRLAEQFDSTRLLQLIQVSRESNT